MPETPRTRRPAPALRALIPALAALGPLLTFAPGPAIARSQAVAPAAAEASLRSYAEGCAGRRAYGIYLGEDKIGWSIADVRLGTLDEVPVLISEEQTLIRWEVFGEPQRMESRELTWYSLAGEGPHLRVGVTALRAPSASSSRSTSTPANRIWGMSSSGPPAMAPLSDSERAWVLNAAVRRLDEWGYDQQFRGLLDAILNAGADPNLWVCDEAMTDPSTSCLHGIGAWWSARLPLPMAIEWAMGNSGSESTLPVVELLLTAGADPDRRDAGDGAAIELAAMFGDDPDLLDLLLRHSDRPVADLAVAALRKNDIPVIQKLMSLSGMSVNALVDGNRSPLHVAAGAGNLAAVEYLVGHGADVNASDADGRTALMLASATADVRTTAALLAHGVDVHAVDVTGRDALWHALESGDPFSDGHSRRRCSTVVEHLLEAGAVLHPHHAWAINWDDSIDADPRALDWVWSLSESMHRGNTVASKKPTQTTSPPPPASG